MFVCSGNAYRSPVAEAILKKLDNSLDVDSAGTSPAIPISDAAKRYLTKENALRFLKLTPEGLDTKDLLGYDLIVAMEPNHKEAILKICKKCSEKIVVWNIDDPYFRSNGVAEKIFDQIKDNVIGLVNSLKKNSTRNT
ncbi:MAG: low molecular weight phosphatase family protein [Candidatus Bathyarchaeota archaeon]|nr:low molecular weight phosphatase family protein [Candidatus Bathyarchaeota archaeon]